MFLGIPSYDVDDSQVGTRELRGQKMVMIAKDDQVSIDSGSIRD